MPPWVNIGAVCIKTNWGQPRRHYLVNLSSNQVCTMKTFINVISPPTFKPHLFELLHPIANANVKSLSLNLPIYVMPRLLLE